MWHGINKEVGAWAKACIACQISKVHRHVKGPLSTFKVLSRHFDHINIDLVGPLPLSSIDSLVGLKLYLYQVHLLAPVLGP